VDPLLKRVSIFAGLDEEALNVLTDHAQEIIAPPDTVIVREGESGNKLFLIGAGSIRVWKHFGQPDAVQLATLAPGDFFGEMCILETLPRAATAQAATDSKLFRISSMAFLHLYEKKPAAYGILVLNIARDLSRRLRKLDEAFAARH